MIIHSTPAEQDGRRRALEGVILRRNSRGAIMHLKHRVLILLGAGLCGAAIVGCQEDNESAFRKSAPAVNQASTGAQAPPKNQQEYYQQQMERQKKGMAKYPGSK